MKVRIFQSEKGDCLLVEGGTSGRIMIDGGMPASYKAHVNAELGKMRKAGDKIDLLCVSHIDEDHIGGVLEMLKNELAWRRWDRFQKKPATNAKVKKPTVDRPPAVDEIWHNAFALLVDDIEGEISDMLAASARILTQVPPEEPEKSRHSLMTTAINVIQSRKQAAEVSRLVSAQSLNIPLNKRFGGKLAIVGKGQRSLKVGSLKLTLLAPHPEDVEKLRDEWRAWLNEVKSSANAVRDSTKFDLSALGIDAGQALAGPWLELAKRLGNRKSVTVPNLASIMFMLEEGGKRALFTGDGHGDDLEKGLQLKGFLKKGGTLHVDLLKVPHHGSEHNTTETFFETVTADHYVFCGNGAHENPDLDIVEHYLDARTRVGPQKSFKFWFNSSSKMPDGKKKDRDHMKAVERLIAKWQAPAKLGNRLRAEFFVSASKTVSV